MDTKRINGITITDAALGAFEAGDPKELHRALSLSPWTPSPLKVESPYPPSWVSSNGLWAKDWRTAWQFRQALQEAA